MGMQSAPIKRAKVAYCAECRCELTLFTGTHIMMKDGKHKTVCGLCCGQLEIEGWREIAGVKE